jgi:hypothetical protein
LFKSLSDFCSVINLCDICVHRRFIKSPVLGSTGSLDQSCAIGLRNRETWEPDNFGLFNINPRSVLLKSSLVVINPVD